MNSITDEDCLNWLADFAKVLMDAKDIQEYGMGADIARASELMGAIRLIDMLNPGFSERNGSMTLRFTKKGD